MPGVARGNLRKIEQKKFLLPLGYPRVSSKSFSQFGLAVWPAIAEGTFFASPAMALCTVVGDYINTMKLPFYLNFDF